MRVQPATIDDVWFILIHAHRWHLEEISKAGLSHRQFLYKAEEWLRRNGGETLYIDGRPACVVMYDGNYTAFLATEDYYKGGLPVIRHAQRYWRDVAAKREVRSLVYDRPELLRWLALLGFEEVSKEGKFVLLRLRSTKPAEAAISA